jgi:hypothetical protein
LEVNAGQRRVSGIGKFVVADNELVVIEDQARQKLALA